MPSLREQLAVAIVSGDPYPLLGALVAAVEPEDSPIDEQYNDARDTRIDQLQKQLADAEREIERLRRGCHYIQEPTLAEAKAEIERLRKRKAWWEHSVESWKTEEQSWHDEMDELRKELAKAKAEIERLRKSCQQCEWEQLCKSYAGLCTEAEVVVKSIKADAALGRLVRGMRKYTRLTRGDVLYKAERQKVGSWFGVQAESCHMLWVTAKEALCAIQEVGDA